MLQIHLLVGDPPYTLKAEAEARLRWLAGVMARPGEPTEWTVRWLAGE